ncbi:MAG: acyl-CoA ligase (AMP-forming), exosortase A system-associated [Woeseia sp.]
MSDTASHTSSLHKLPDILTRGAERNPGKIALTFKDDSYSYAELSAAVAALSRQLASRQPMSQARVAVLLPNCPEAVIAAFGTMLTGGIYVPVNPLLRPRQIEHVLKDSGATVLVSTSYLFHSIANVLESLPAISTVILADATETAPQTNEHFEMLTWHEALVTSCDITDDLPQAPGLDDPALIFYTSGSTGRAKGVLVSHRNLLDGVRIISGYLENSDQDRILATLPMSFDYGFSQITTAFYTSAEVVLTNYSMPQQLLGELRKYRITGLAGVPTMWAQLVTVVWPEDVTQHLRYMTNSGGRIPSSVLQRLRARAENARLFLMYGLTESFRSTYLDPSQIDARSDSIGKAIPGVTIDVVNANGESCAPGEPGELVHSGALVSMGYWQNSSATAERFKPLPAALSGDNPQRLAVWSGDVVSRDEDGYLFFVDRADHMLKSSGYRISPAEVEEVIHASDLVEHVIAVGLPDERVGQRIAIAVVPKSLHEDNDFAIRHVCARELPPYMQPDEILILKSLPLTAHGKPDRPGIRDLFSTAPVRN